MRTRSIFKPLNPLIFFLCTLAFWELSTPAIAQTFTSAGMQQDAPKESQKPIARIIGEFLRGGNEETLNVLYFGNSRVAKKIGFPVDGMEKIIDENQRLAGNGFVVPLKGYAQDDEDYLYLKNGGDSMGSTPSNWQATDSISMLYAHRHPGLLLEPGRSLKFANLGDSVATLPKDSEVTLTVYYLAGPDKGTFIVTPIEVEGNTKIISQHQSTLIDCAHSEYEVRWVNIPLPSMNNISLNRSFLLEADAGQAVVYKVSAFRNIADGVNVGELGVSGEGYTFQAEKTNVPAAAWTAYVEGFAPDIAIWQYANNQGASNDDLVTATKEFMDRVETVNPNVIHILTYDHPTPRANWQSVVNRSIQWADSLNGYRGAIVIDPTPFLPPDFTILAGTETLGDYFSNNVHENRLGAYVVFDAIWQALLKNY